MERVWALVWRYFRKDGGIAMLRMMNKPPVATRERPLTRTEPVSRERGARLASHCARQTAAHQPRLRPLQASLEIENELLAIAAARELPRVAFDDALRVCLALRDGDPDRYQRAAVRLGRFARETRDSTTEDLRLAADALDALQDRTAEAMERLQGLCVAHGVG